MVCAGSQTAPLRVYRTLSPDQGPAARLPARCGFMKSNTTASGSRCARKAHGCVASREAGTNWADRFPAIVEAARRLCAQSFLIDGEAIICRPDGISDFAALRIGRRAHEVTLAAFDLIELQGDDLPLFNRKQRLARILERGREAIIFNEHITHDGPGRIRERLPSCGRFLCRLAQNLMAGLRSNLSSSSIFSI